MILQVNTLYDISIKVFDHEDSIFKDCISRRISLFRNGNRARIQQCITFLFLCPEHMCVAVDQNIPLLKWRQIVFIIDMSVGSIKSTSASQLPRTA